MAAALSGIWNQPTAASQSALSSANPMATSSNSSSTDGATISANDFLTLLVTEMQNQDPTANTDPNEYINQLVNVNSLEQLIQINQTLSSAAGTTTSGHAAPQTSASQPVTNSAAATAAHPAASALSSPAVAPAAINRGNLGAPAANPSALRVARSLEAPRITR